jgi:hypothetical protein
MTSGGETEWYLRKTRNGKRVKTKNGKKRNGSQQGKTEFFAFFFSIIVALLFLRGLSG